jgi:hypothetical protein
MSLSRRFLLALVLLLAGLLGAAPVAFAQTTALVGGTVHPVSEPAIEDGVVLLEGDTIAAVGPRADVSIPDDARRIDAAGHVVTPGLIDAATSTGLIEVSAVGSTRDQALDSDDAVRAAFRVTDGINPNSVVIPVTRLGGVTTVASIPSGGAISGQGAVIDLHGATLRDMLVRDRAAMYAHFTPEAAEATGEARGGLALRLREALEDARFYAENEEAYRQGATRALSASRWRHWRPCWRVSGRSSSAPRGPATSPPPSASPRNSTWPCAFWGARRPGCGPTGSPPPTCR